MDVFAWQHYPRAALDFLLFAAVCGMLLDSRLGRRGTLIVASSLLAAIAALQAGLVLSGADDMLILTLLPLTAYLPVVVGVHALSCNGFLQTAAVWMVGGMAAFVLVFLQKLLVTGVLGGAALRGGLAMTGCVLACALVLALVAWRWLRGPFRTHVPRGDAGWLPLGLCAASVFLLLSYFGNSPVDPLVTAIIFLVALSVYAVMARAILAASRAQEAQEARQEAAAQLEIQRGEYAGLLSKLEAGRAYRHDMRHHLMVLEELAGKGDNEELSSYLEGLGARLRETEPARYCESASVNAVLVSCVARAREEGCAVEARASVAEESPFDDLDVCVLLANALENAVNACRAVEGEGPLAIEVSVELERGRNLVVSVENPCAEPVRFDAAGLPVGEEREGHGIGLKSIRAVVDKYDGLLRCSYEEGRFRLQAVLCAPAEKAELKRRPGFSRHPAQAPGTLALGCALLLAAGCLPAVARASDGRLFEVAQARVEGFRWGATAFNVAVPRVEALASVSASTGQEDASAEDAPDEPQATAPSPAPAAPEAVEPPASGTLSWESGSGDDDASAPLPSVPEVTIPVVPVGPNGGDGAVDPPPALVEGVDEINRQMEAYVEQMREKFLWYAARKYNGYVGMDVVYDVVRDDDALLAIRFVGTLNAGGSGEYSRTFTLDKRTGSFLELADLFAPGADYVGIVSAEVLRQMTEQVDAGTADYFIPGGIWRPDECFQRIAPDQHFYIDGANRLVIVFDEYEVAPGRAGMPEFAIPTSALAGLLSEPSILA